MTTLTPSQFIMTSDYRFVRSYVGVNREDIPEMVSTLSDAERKNLIEEVDQILLITPEGTDDPELEEALINLSDFFHPQ